MDAIGSGGGVYLESEYLGLCECQRLAVDLYYAFPSLGNVC